MEEGKLKQTPVRELEKYWENEIIYKRVKVNGTAFLKGISGRVFDLTLTIRDMHCDAVEIRLAKRNRNISVLCTIRYMRSLHLTGSI